VSVQIHISIYYANIPLISVQLLYSVNLKKLEITGLPQAILISGLIFYCSFSEPVMGSS